MLHLRISLRQGYFGMKTDAPRWLLDYFRVDRDAGLVRWATNDELRDEPPRRNKRIPFGEQAGGREVIGHGQLVSFSGRNLLTCDIRAAILAGYEWPWDAYKSYVVPFELPTLQLDRRRALVDLASRTWHMVDGHVHWTERAHSTIPAGERAKGIMIAGRDEPMVTRQGTGWMLKDIKYMLTNSCTPDTTPPDWD